MRSERRRKVKDIGVWCVLGVVVLLVWMLFSVPTIIFSLISTDDSDSEVIC